MGGGARELLVEDREGGTGAEVGGGGGGARAWDAKGITGLDPGTGGRLPRFDASGDLGDIEAVD